MQSCGWDQGMGVPVWEDLESRNAGEEAVNTEEVLNRTLTLCTKLPVSFWNFSFSLVFLLADG